ncbi:MAG: hypothetical protein GXP59_04340 [Deltaproteobacteria bacterium]|nr:hypothetical protein [Deltaproteobacteria bacterium]
MIFDPSLVNANPQKNHNKKEATMEKKYSKDLRKVIQIDENQLRDHLGELVRGSVEETLNKLLDAER